MAAVAAVAAVSAVLAVSADAPDWAPPTLRDTGLYSDWASKTVAPGNLLFTPQYPLWTDGAHKTRWLHLPEGTFIDASNPDIWQFPVGTRVWKEFRFSRRAETRLIELTRDGWKFAAYEWNEDESEAPLAPERGVRRSVLIRDGIHHSIPSRIDCLACHEASPMRLLGVSALQLSSDRDPNAPHADTPPEGSVDLSVLVARGLVRNLPERFVKTPPRIVAPTPTGRAALGYLHGNCGPCHTRAGELASLSFALNYTLARPEGEACPVMTTAVGHVSKFRVAAAASAVERICAGKPEESVLVWRMSSRHPLLQMPPLGTHIVDDDAVRLIRTWIAEDLSPGRAALDDKEQR